MIQRFHEVIERRSILQAKIFIDGCSKLSLAGNMTSEAGGWESGETKTPGEKVVKDSEEEEREERRSSNEVICENLKLIVLRPQLGNNNIQGRQSWGNFHNYILGM